MTFYFWLGEGGEEYDWLGLSKPSWIYCHPDDLGDAQQLLSEAPRDGQQGDY